VSRLACGLLVAIAVSASSGSAAAAVPRFGHVFVIVGENTSVEQITPAHAPFLTGTIKPRGAWVTGDRSFRRSSSLGQYIAIVAGRYTRCEANNDLPDDCHRRAATLFGQLSATGRSWRDWEESMANPCSPLDSGAAWARNIYSAHHNPALYFTGLQGGRFDEAIAPAAPCRDDDLPMGNTGPDDTSAFDAALAAGRVGDMNLIVPNDCENGHDLCGTRDRIRQFDDFLAREVPKIQASPAFGADGLIIVTWDEGADAPQHPDHVLLAAHGPLVRAGAIDGSRHDHYGLERTLAAGFGVAPLAHARSARTLTAIWNRPKPGGSSPHALRAPGGPASRAATARRPSVRRPARHARADLSIGTRQTSGLNGPMHSGASGRTCGGHDQRPYPSRPGGWWRASSPSPPPDRWLRRTGHNPPTRLVQRARTPRQPPALPNRAQQRRAGAHQARCASVLKEPSRTSANGAPLWSKRSSGRSPAPAVDMPTYWDVVARVPRFHGSGGRGRCSPRLPQIPA
jgi:phosphatidylinositol-3-phosphatase